MSTCLPYEHPICFVNKLFSMFIILSFLWKLIKILWWKVDFVIWSSMVNQKKFNCGFCVFASFSTQFLILFRAQQRFYYHLTGICSKNWEGCNNYYWCKIKSNTSRNRKRMQATLAHFLHPYEFFARCILFKCHKCIAKSSIWQKYLKVKIINLNKNIY
jgi:uncharacterized protein YggT (Ycf19 family)